MGTERNISGIWPNHFFIPADADFDPYAPKLSDIYNAINTSRLSQGGYIPKAHESRTYAAPLHFFNYIKEQDTVTEVQFRHTNGNLNSIDTNGTLPEVFIGTDRHGSKTNTWTGHVGGLDISYKTDASRHIELALEHLVAAHTAPTLKAAWEKHEEERVAAYLEEAALKDKQAADVEFLCSEQALAALELYNERIGGKLVSWGQLYPSDPANVTVVNIARNWIGYIEKQKAVDLEAFLNSPEALAALAYWNSTEGKYREVTLESWVEGRWWGNTAQDVARRWMGLHAENVALTKQKAADYRLKRRDMLAEKVGGTGYTYRTVSATVQSDIDHIIDREIADGACK